MKRKLGNTSLRTPVQKKVRSANTQVVRKHDGVETSIEKGSFSELPIERDPSNKTPLVGISKGITKNMQNYESLRIDVWYSDVIQDNETPEEALSRVESVVDVALENAVSYYLDD